MNYSEVHTCYNLLVARDDLLKLVEHIQSNAAGPFIIVPRKSSNANDPPPVPLPDSATGALQLTQEQVIAMLRDQVLYIEKRLAEKMVYPDPAAQSGP